jgi:uncharacterized protein YwqG
MNKETISMMYRKHQEILNQMCQMEQKLRQDINDLMDGINQLKREAYKQNVELD